MVFDWLLYAISCSIGISSNEDGLCFKAGLWLAGQGLSSRMPSPEEELSVCDWLARLANGMFLLVIGRAG